MDTGELSDNEKRLEELLLSGGGNRVVGHQGDPDADALVSRGNLSEPRETIMAPGAPNQCHSNVVRCHYENPHMEVHTGFALSSDGIWRSHSWGMVDGAIVETTEQRVKYFGIRLEGDDLEDFLFYNY